MWIMTECQTVVWLIVQWLPLVKGCKECVSRESRRGFVAVLFCFHDGCWRQFLLYCGWLYEFVHLLTVIEPMVPSPNEVSFNVYWFLMTNIQKRYKYKKVVNCVFSKKSIVKEEIIWHTRKSIASLKISGKWSEKSTPECMADLYSQFPM